MDMTSPGRAVHAKAPRSFRRIVSDPVNICFAVILLIASFLRLWQVGHNGLSGDESVYAGQAAVLAGVHGYSRYFILVSRGNSNFLLFQEILSVFFRVFGVSGVTARLVGAFFGIALVAVVYGIGRLVIGPRGGLVAMLLAALSSYSVELARLALLDTCAAFLMALSVLLFLLWVRDCGDPRFSRRANWYFAAFAAASVLACEAKVTSVLLLPIVAVYLVITRYYRRITLKALLRAAVAGAIALLPAMYQIVKHAGVIKGALGSSVQRTSPVPWTYYLDILRGYEGLAAMIGVLIALLCAVRHPRRTDLLIWLWFLADAGFLQIYPLKAYNYLLVVVVPLTLLCAAGLVRTTRAVLAKATPRRLASAVALAGLAVLAGAGVAEAATHLDPQLDSVQNPGIEQVAAWLDAHTSDSAGVIALSQGSAQYAVAFYAHRDSYPFGRFRLATVLPGGQVVQPKVTPKGKLPTDWVTTLPNQYVQNGTITYFVYGLTEVDDPSELTYAGLHLTQRNYLALIQAYGGKLVDRIAAGHHDEVLIFEATRRSPTNRLKLRIDHERIVLSGSGFSSSAPLTMYYHDQKVGTGYSNAQGDATVAVRYPIKTRRTWQFVLKDPEGHYAAADGLGAPVMADRLTSSGLQVTGSWFAPGTQVSITYMKATLARAEVSPRGTVAAIIHLPRKSGRHYRLRMIDAVGRTASVIGLTPAKLSFVQSGSHVTVTGVNFNPDTQVTISYGGTGVGQAETGPTGDFTQSVRLSGQVTKKEQLRAVDAYGRGATATGLTPATITAVRGGDIVTVAGTGFDPGSLVSIKYGEKQVGDVVTNSSGAFTVTVDVKSGKGSSGVTATDAQGLSAHTQVGASGS
jgi:4-amino-4-deoxy-L-arabinose transferase-like glycosyltransferase